MHFFYLDEAGCNGRDLDNDEQPIFVMGSVIISDEKWNSTNQSFNSIISNHFDGNIPDDFELHTEQLLSPEGDGPFHTHPRERRNNLVDQLLDLLIEKSHHTAYIGIDKQLLSNALPINCGIKDYLDFTAPYLISFDYLLSLFEWYTKTKLGSSARALIILDKKDEFEHEMRSIVKYQKYLVPNSRRLKWIVEFSYLINSHINPMVQLADLISYITKKYLEIENGYREEYNPEVKDVYRGLYTKINQRLIRKTIVKFDTRVSAQNYYEVLNSIRSVPTRLWRSRVY